MTKPKRVRRPHPIPGITKFQFRLLDGSVYVRLEECDLGDGADMRHHAAWLTRAAEWIEQERGKK